MKQILEEAKNLVCNEGEVWLWRSDNMKTVNFFATKEDAQKYIELRNQWRREKGMKVESYSIGTEDDFMAAAKKYEADKKANEVKEYGKHVDKIIERLNFIIKALDGLIRVCRKFDGKVINRRFHDAVYETTGFCSSFDINLDRYELYCYDYENNDACVYIRADWSHGINRYTGKKKDVDPNDWQWNTGDRLEAEKAVVVIENQKKINLERIKVLRATKKKYAAYLRLARQAEDIFKKMQVFDLHIRDYAAEHDLSQYSYHSYFWKGY